MREVREISIEQIHPNRHQPRTEFNQDALMELAQSIRENGLIQPITVRPDEEGYEIIAGERRYKACILAGYSEVPCNVMSADEQRLAELALVENIQRENLTAIEEAKAYVQIMRSSGMTQEELALRVGKSQSTVANKVRLLNLPQEIQEAVASRQITERHARALLSVVPGQQKEVYDQIVRRGMNVRQTEQLVKRLQSQKPEPEKKAPAPVDYVAEAERDLSNRLGRACHITHGKKKGKLEITYYGVEDLNDLLEALGRLEFGK